MSRFTINKLYALLSAIGVIVLFCSLLVIISLFDIARVIFIILFLIMLIGMVVFMFYDIIYTAFFENKDLE